MEDEWASDGLDEALASVCALAEQSPPPLTIEVSSEDGDYGDYYDWNRNWETQNLQNGLFSPNSDPDLAEGDKVDHCTQPREPVYLERVSEFSGGDDSGSTNISDFRCSSGKPLEFSSCVRRPTDFKEQATSRRTCQISDSAPVQNKRKVLGENFDCNKRLREENSEKEIPTKEETVGRIASHGLLSAHQALQVRWRNGVFSGRTYRELYAHCNGVVSNTQRFIHDVVQDTDGRRINQLLEQLSTTRKSNGLWVVSLHRRNGAPNHMVLPGTLPSRSEAIQAAMLINSDYGPGPDRHAHIIHVCPWAGGYCRCRPLQDIPVKRRTRPSRPWRYISEQHFINIIMYMLRHPRQLCLFEVGGTPIDDALGSGI